MFVVRFKVTVTVLVWFDLLRNSSHCSRNVSVLGDISLERWEIFVFHCFFNYNSSLIYTSLLFTISGQFFMTSNNEKLTF